MQQAVEWSGTSPRTAKCMCGRRSPSVSTPLADAQPQTAGTDGATVPRTPRGDPDLQAIWNNFTITPLERPANLAGQEFLSPEEAAALEQRVAVGCDRQNAHGTVRTEPLPAGGDVGAFNSDWTDQGTRVVPTRRTSLIVDPSNGRLPPLTAVQWRSTASHRPRTGVLSMRETDGSPRMGRRSSD